LRFLFDDSRDLVFACWTLEDVVSSIINVLLFEDILLRAFMGAAEQLAIATADIFNLRSGRWERNDLSPQTSENTRFIIFLSITRFLYALYSFMVYFNHEIYYSFDLEHKVIGTLAVSRSKAKLRERNFLCSRVDIEVHDFGWGPTIRDWPNSGGSEFLNNIKTTKDGAREVEHIFAVPDPSRSMVVGRSANNS
jgi:hypothetical protein